jgi:hypothetical protein
MTMAHEIDLRKHQTVSNSGILYKDTDSVQADFGIRIISLGDQGPFDFMLFGPLIIVRVWISFSTEFQTEARTKCSPSRRNAGRFGSRRL